MLNQKIIQQMSNDEIMQREKWGPNLHHKVYKVLADSKLDYQNKLILGPRVIDGVYEYEININLKENNMIDPFIIDLTIFILAIFVGYFVVWSVTSALHTPLMSVTNAISGIIIVGALIALGSASNEISNMSKWLGFIAIIIASINIFGGFVVTWRMLSMFKKNKGKDK